MKIFQGDVAYIPVSEEQFQKILGNKKFKGKKIVDSFIVVHGESGNSHKIKVDTKDLVEIMECGEGIFGLKIRGQAIITHEKHLPEQKLGSGLYLVTRKTEYDPIEERLVRD